MNACECGCGREVRRRFAHGHNRRGIEASSHPSWRGGQYVDRGYVKLLKPEHPMSGSNGRVLEHRYVMSEHLGRALTDEEVVHHENEIKDDNRIENLRLFATQAEHLEYHRRQKALCLV